MGRPGAIVVRGGKLGVLPSGALALFGPDGTCPACCGGGPVGGPCVCSVQVAADGSRCGFADALTDGTGGCVVTGSCDIRTTASMIIQGQTAVDIVSESKVVIPMGAFVAVRSCLGSQAISTIDRTYVERSIVNSTGTPLPWTCTASTSAAGGISVSPGAILRGDPAAVWRGGDPTSGPWPSLGLFYGGGFGGVWAGGSPAVTDCFVRYAVNPIREAYGGPLATTRPRVWAEVGFTGLDLPSDGNPSAGFPIVDLLSVTGSVSATRDTACGVDVAVDAVARFIGRFSFPGASYETGTADVTHEITVRMSHRFAQCVDLALRGPIDPRVIEAAEGRLNACCGCGDR